MSHIVSDAAFFIRSFIAQRAQQEMRDIEETSDLFAAGLLDSLGLLELVTAIEQRFAVTIDFSELDVEQFSRIGDFAALVGRATGAETVRTP